MTDIGPKAFSRRKGGDDERPEAGDQAGASDSAGETTDEEALDAAVAEAADQTSGLPDARPSDEAADEDLDAAAASIRKARGLGGAEESSEPASAPEVMIGSSDQSTKDFIRETVADVARDPERYISPDKKKGSRNKGFLIVVAASVAIAGIALAAFLASEGGDAGEGEPADSASESLSDPVAERARTVTKIRGNVPTSRPSTALVPGQFAPGAFAENKSVKRRSSTKYRGKKASPTLVEDKNMNALDSALEDRFGGRPTLPGYGDEAVASDQPRRPLRDDSPIGVYVRKDDPKNKKAKLGVPSASFLKARLLNAVRSSNSRTPVLAAIAADVTAAGEVILPKGTKLVGSAAAEDNRLHIRFRKIVLADGREIAFSGIAMMADGSAGLVGRVTSKGGSGVKGGLAEAALETASDLLPGGDNVGEKLGSRAGQAGLDHLGDRARAGGSGETVVSVPTGTAFQVFVEDGF